MASDVIMLTINDKGELAEFKEPYAEILVETEEDYSYIEDALNIVMLTVLYFIHSLLKFVMPMKN